jgi:hypothetical protein
MNSAPGAAWLALEKPWKKSRHGAFPSAKVHFAGKNQGFLQNLAKSPDFL